MHLKYIFLGIACVAIVNHLKFQNFLQSFVFSHTCDDSDKLRFSRERGRRGAKCLTGFIFVCFCLSYSHSAIYSSFDSHFLRIQMSAWVSVSVRVCFARSLALKIHHADIWLHNHCRISCHLLICRYRTHRNVFHFYKFRAFSFHLTQKRSRIYAIIIAHPHTHAHKFHTSRTRSSIWNVCAVLVGAAFKVSVVFVFALIFLWIGYIDARAHCTRSQSNTRCVNNIVYKKNEHTSWFSKERRDREKKHKLFRPEEGDFDWACACVCLHMIVLCHLLSFSLFVFLRHLLASWFIQTRFLPPYRPNVHMR